MNTKLENKKISQATYQWLNIKSTFQQRHGVLKALKESAQKNKKTSTGLMVAKKKLEPCPFLELNDYCLKHIYETLDLQSQLQLSVCHSRLSDIFINFIAPRLPKRLEFRTISHLLMNELKEYFKIVGPFLTSMEVSSSFWKLQLRNVDTTIYALLQKYCKSIYNVQVVQRRFIFTNFLDMLDKNIITELELYECDLSNMCLDYLLGLPNIEVLGLAFNRNINGAQLPKMIKIKKLNLYGCPGIEQDVLVKICESLKLQYLDIRHRDKLTYLNIDDMIKFCDNLEVLKIPLFRVRDTKFIANLPKLKHLEIDCTVQAMPATFYKALVENHEHDLEVLKITGRVYFMFPTVAASISRFHNLKILWLGDNIFSLSSVSLKLLTALTQLEEVNIRYSVRLRGKHILKLLERCPKIKRLGLRLCRQIKTSFVFKAIKLLDSREPQPKKPLLILVQGTRIKRDILQCPCYLNSRHLVQLSFQEDRSLPGFLQEQTEFDIENDYNFNEAAKVIGSGYSPTELCNSELMSDTSDEENMDTFFLL